LDFFSLQYFFPNPTFDLSIVSLFVFPALTVVNSSTTSQYCLYKFKSPNLFINTPILYSNRLFFHFFY
jgi:hypothetical protein